MPTSTKIHKKDRDKRLGNASIIFKWRVEDDAIALRTRGNATMDFVTEQEEEAAGQHSVM